MGEEELVLSRVENGVGYLTLNRPEAFNAMSLELAELFLKKVDAFAADDNVRAVVVDSAAKIFCAGGDIKQMMSDVERGDRDAYFREPLSAFNRMAMALRNLPKPVVAAARGCSGLLRRGAEPLESSLVGQHGSLTHAEQRIPLLLAHR